MAVVLIVFARITDDGDQVGDYLFESVSLSYVTLITEAMPEKWFHRSTKFLSTWLVLYLWLLGGHFLTLAYK